MGGIALSRLALQFQLTAPDGPLKNNWQRLLGIAADFQLVVDHRVLWSEAHFPVVELARQLSIWLTRASNLEPFAYASLESDVPGLVRFEPRPSGWAVSSAYQVHPSPTAFSTSELCTAVREFVQRVRESVQQAHGFDPLQG